MTKEEIKKEVEEAVNRRITPYVRGEKGIANYLCLSVTSPLVKDLKKHLKPFPLSQKTMLYRKDEIDELLERMRSNG